MSEIRVENIIGETGTDAVQLTKGINTTGTLTSTNVSTASSITAATFHGNGAGLTGVTAGKLLRKSAYTIARQSISSHAAWPGDDTIPQIDEGVEFFSQAYTPSTANCDLYIYCSAGIRERTNIADDLGMALFVSGTNDALRVVTSYMSGYCQGEHLHLYHKMPSWGASAKTFSLRCHKGNAINYQAVYNAFFQEKFSADASATLFIIEEIAT